MCGNNANIYCKLRPRGIAVNLPCAQYTIASSTCLLHATLGQGATTQSSGLCRSVTVLLWRGQVRAVGVCNYNAGQVEEMHGLLAKHGIPLASNQARA
jgi:diketogulonate reductase-like aldo/keto reductase